MKITAKELAEKLNLSPAAVSIALNGRHGVSTETRKRVLDAAEKYGYDFTRISEKRGPPERSISVFIKSTAPWWGTRRSFPRFRRGLPPAVKKRSSG